MLTQWSYVFLALTHRYPRKRNGPLTWYHGYSWWHNESVCGVVSRHIQSETHHNDVMQWRRFKHYWPFRALKNISCYSYLSYFYIICNHIMIPFLITSDASNNEKFVRMTTLLSQWCNAQAIQERASIFNRTGHHSGHDWGTLLSVRDCGPFGDRAPIDEIYGCLEPLQYLIIRLIVRSCEVTKAQGGMYSCITVPQLWWNKYV